MRNELLFLKKTFNFFIDQTKTSSQEILEIKVNKQTNFFLIFSSQSASLKKGTSCWQKQVLRHATLFFKITDDNISFTICTPDHWSDPGSADKLNEIIMHNLRIDLHLHNQEGQKRLLYSFMGCCEKSYTSL